MVSLNYRPRQPSGYCQSLPESLLFIFFIKTSNVFQNLLNESTRHYSNKIMKIIE